MSPNRADCLLLWSTLRASIAADFVVVSKPPMWSCGDYTDVELMLHDLDVLMDVHIWPQLALAAYFFGAALWEDLMS
jgi:hypothetical protein